ncbi:MULTISPECIES: alkaline phosphatase [unclassified Lentimonas]|uniref:alkaline phosphatase D family protein n=1 Tax=unclassified Lentimonas TaxID=2630993 RepID=UPI001FD56832|nr:MULTISPECIES: alkaline phosphatase D family protein [unclassified Lentimonas]
MNTTSMTLKRPLCTFLLPILVCSLSLNAYDCCGDAVKEILLRQCEHKVTLKQAHMGSLEIDTLLLDSFGAPPENIRQFYLESRAALEADKNGTFTLPEVLKAAQKNDIDLMGGPILGDITAESVVVWLRPATNGPIEIDVTNRKSKYTQQFTAESVQAGVELRITLDGLFPDNCYDYVVKSDEKELAKGSFTTALRAYDKGITRIVFGSDFHKIGVHNPQLLQQMLKREPLALLIIGDNTVDDRKRDMNMHRADYLLRDVSQPWSVFAANVPVYATWDDHDYYNNDVSGIVGNRFTESDRKAVRKVWHQNWNNPIREDGPDGIYFNTRIGPVEIFMLDTRSYRENERRGEYTSYLGKTQQEWLKQRLKASTAPYKILSSGTMWSDYVTDGKDSWGTWDTEAREEIFQFIEDEAINGVLLISGDRHGARGFTIPRPSGFKFYEFECGTLGGVPGPGGIVKGCEEQLFGYNGHDTVAFGEFVFNTELDEPTVTFRLIRESGELMEEHVLNDSQLSTK